MTPFEFKITADEFGNDRRQETHDAHAGMKAQRALRRRLQSPCDLVRLLKLGEDVQGTLVVVLPDLGQANLSCGAIEKPHAQPIPLGQRFRFGPYRANRC